MSGGSWPFIPHECPDCRYIHPFAPHIDDSGYELRGFCRHPMIAMELFVPRERAVSRADHCRFFTRGTEDSHR